MDYRAKVVGTWALIIATGLFITMIIAASHVENMPINPSPMVTDGSK